MHASRMSCLCMHLLSVFYSQILAITTATALSPISCGQTREFETKLKALVSSGDYTLAMAISKLLIASLVVSLLVLQEVNASIGVSSIAGKNIDCGGACKYRCSLSSRPHLCNRACGTCCARCKCVPKGTSGNLDTCPCYATMTTHGGRRKCP